MDWVELDKKEEVEVCLDRLDQAEIDYMKTGYSEIRIFLDKVESDLVSSDVIVQSTAGLITCRLFKCFRCLMGDIENLKENIDSYVMQCENGRKSESRKVQKAPRKGKISTKKIKHAVMAIKNIRGVKLES